MQIYLAGPYPQIDVLRDFRDELVRRGHTVTAQWLGADTQLDAASARMDLADIDRADIFVVLNDEEWAEQGSGGRHVELGWALAHDKSIFLIGERSNVFHYLPAVRVLPDFTALLDLMPG